MQHAVPEGNSSTMQIVGILRSGELPYDSTPTRDYEPRHAAVETHPLTDRPTEEIVFSVPGPIVSGPWDGPDA